MEAAFSSPRLVSVTDSSQTASRTGMAFPSVSTNVAAAGSKSTLRFGLCSLGMVVALLLVGQDH